MRIIVATLTGKRISIPDIKREDNFELLAQVLYEKEGIPENQQRFIFAGKEIEQARTFQDYNVQNDSLIHLVLRLRGGNSDTEIPTISMIAHGGIRIEPSFPFVHDCKADAYRENYVKVYECQKPLHFMKPLKLTFDLSKLCQPRDCLSGKSKQKGGGFLIDKTNRSKWGSERFGRLKIYELVRGRMYTDSYAKMIRNRKEVLNIPFDFIDPKNVKGGYYNCKNVSKLPKQMITKRIFPSGRDQWKPNAMYMCIMYNYEGGFRWRFKTCETEYHEEEDEQERVQFLLQNELEGQNVKLTNKNLKSSMFLMTQ